MQYGYKNAAKTREMSKNFMVPRECFLYINNNQPKLHNRKTAYNNMTKSCSNASRNDNLIF